MKIIGVSGSNRVNSYSFILLNKTIESIQQYGIETEIIKLSDYNIKFCKGCMSCTSGEECILDDDLNFLKNKLLDSDGIILSTPTHGKYMSSLMKTFIDRIGMYSVYRSAFNGKYFAGISVAGAIGAKRAAKSLRILIDGFHKPAYFAGILSASIGFHPVESYFNKANKLGKLLVLAIKQKKKFILKMFFPNLIRILFMKPIMNRNINKNKDGIMKGVYKYLKERKMIS